MKAKYNTSQLVERWEDRREIKNLLGIYSQCLLVKKERDIFPTLWSQERDDVCFGVNDGWYSGREAIADYYEKMAQATMIKSKAMQKAFPKELGDKTDEALYGVGTLDIKSLNNYIVEIADDRETAKLFCVIIGMVTDMDNHGPVSNWLYAYICADLVMENGAWKLWHMKELREIFEPEGTKWAVKDKPFPFEELPEFEELRGLELPKPNVPVKLWEKYHGTRQFTKPPRLPEPYLTFKDTFTYGMEDAK